jgi:hypothetical protein
MDKRKKGEGWGKINVVLLSFMHLLQCCCVFELLPVQAACVSSLVRLKIRNPGGKARFKVICEDRIQVVVCHLA